MAGSTIMKRLKRALKDFAMLVGFIALVGALVGVLVAPLSLGLAYICIHGASWLFPTIIGVGFLAFIFVMCWKDAE